MKHWLIDSGPLVPYLSAKDSAHQSVVGRLGEFTGQLFTTRAVVTEAVHFLAQTRLGPRALVEFLIASQVVAVEISTHALRQDCVRLIEKYSDFPMDFADATLALLAGRLGVTDILTLDRRGFAAFRTVDQQPFRLVLDQ